MNEKLLNLDWAHERVSRARVVRERGRLYRVSGDSMICRGIEANLGDLALLTNGSESQSLVEAVALDGDRVVFLPLEDVGTAGPSTIVELVGEPLSLPVGRHLLGRVLDGLGRPMDGGPKPESAERVYCGGSSPNPMTRRPIQDCLSTGVSSLDGLLTIGKGQRIGIFAGGGVGKSTLLGKIARDSAASINVIALIGERGLEVRSFVEKNLGPEGMARSVVIVATSDTPAQQRYRATFLAVAIAEYFRDQGEDVLFIMDSMTRFAYAVRETGLMRGEPPTMKGYPPSVFGELPRVIERLGNSDKGSASCLMTVLVEGDDMADPIADALRALLDGHVVLSRDLAEQQHYPSVDVLSSVSRAMNDLISEEHKVSARKFKELYATYKANEDLIQIGAYKRGANPVLDRAVKMMDKMKTFLQQDDQEVRSHEETVSALTTLMAGVR